MKPMTYDEKIEQHLLRIAQLDAELLFEVSASREIELRIRIEKLYEEVARLEGEEGHLDTAKGEK